MLLLNATLHSSHICFQFIYLSFIFSFVVLFSYGGGTLSYIIYSKNNIYNQIRHVKGWRRYDNLIWLWVNERKLFEWHQEIAATCFLFVKSEIWSLTVRSIQGFSMMAPQQPKKPTTSTMEPADIHNAVAHRKLKLGAMEA